MATLNEYHKSTGTLRDTVHALRTLSQSLEIVGSYPLSTKLLAFANNIEVSIETIDSYTTDQLGDRVQDGFNQMGNMLKVAMIIASEREEREE